MDLSDLPQAAQDRIAAAEIEAELILERCKIPAKVARIRAKIPWANPDAFRMVPLKTRSALNKPFSTRRRVIAFTRAAKGQLVIYFAQPPGNTSEMAT